MTILCLATVAFFGCKSDPLPPPGATPDVYCDRMAALSGLKVPEETRQKLRAGCITDATEERAAQIDFYVCKSRCAMASRDMGTYAGCIGGCDGKKKSVTSP